MSANVSDPLPTRYEVTPYVADVGGGSPAGALQLVSILSSVSILVGIVVSLISQSINLILLRIFVGVVIGYCGYLTIKRYHIRRPFVCGCAGFVAGCICCLTMHYTDYWRFQEKVPKVPDSVQQIARDIDKLTAEGEDVPESVREVMASLRADPDALRILQVSSFLEFMEYKAEKGVEFRIPIKRTKLKIHLGREGSIIYWYWFAEALFVAFTATMMVSVAEQPYCLECHSWKDETTLIESSSPPDLIANFVRLGDLSAIEKLLENPDPAKVGSRVSSKVNNQSGISWNTPITFKSRVSSKVNTHFCRNCESAAPFEVSVVKVKTDYKGEASESSLGMITFPGEALVPLVALAARLKTPTTPEVASEPVEQNQ